MTVAPAYVLLGVSLIVLSIIDVRTMRLPTRIVVPVTVASTAWFSGAAVIGDDLDGLARALACAVGACGAFALLFVAAPGALGLGDVRLAFLLGLDLGWLGVEHAVVGLLLGIVAAAATGLGLVAARRRSLSDALPFGPFLAAGALTAVAARDALECAVAA